MTSRPSVPVIFPSASSIIRSAASLRRVPWGEFPDLTGVGSEEAPRGAGLRPPLKRLVRFSRKPLSQRCLIEGSRKEPARSICPPVSGPSSLPPDWASERVSSGHDVRVFHSTNLSASWTLLTPSPSRTDHLCQPTSPAHPAAARAVTRLSPGLKYYSVVRLLAVHPFPLRLSAYRGRYPGANREHDEPSWGHVQIFRTVPLANTLVRRVGKNAFAAIVPARPCPVFGRPISSWGRPLDYGPVLLRKPFRFHLAMDTLPSGCLETVNQLSSSLGCLRRFQLRARLGHRLSAHPGR